MSYTQLIEALPPSHQRISTELGPNGPSEYRSSDNASIQFLIPSQGLVDVNTGYFEAELEIVLGAQAGTVGGTMILDNPGLGAIFDKMSIYAANGTTLYETTNVAEQILIKTRSKGAEYEPAAKNLMGFNAYFDEGVCSNVASPVYTNPAPVSLVDASRVKNVMAGGVSTSSVKAVLTVPWAVLPGPLNPSRGITLPTAFMSDKGNALKVVFTLKPSSSALVFVQTAGSNTFTDKTAYYIVRNPKLCYDVVEVGPEMKSKLQSMANNSTIDLHFCDSVCHEFTALPGNGSKQTFNVNKFTASLRNVILGMRPSARSFLIPNSFFCRNGLTYFQIKAGTRIAPAAGITLETGVSSSKAYTELQKCFKSLHSGSGSIWLPEYHNNSGVGPQLGTWFTGVNLTNTQYSEGSKDEVLQLAGMNTTSTSNIEVRIFKDPAILIDYDVLVFAETDNVLSVGNNSSATFERQ